MYDIDHIVRLRNAVDRYALTYFDGFAKLTCAQLQRMYNGIGPDKFGETVLDLNTDLFRVFEPAALVRGTRARRRVHAQATWRRQRRHLCRLRVRQQPLRRRVQHDRERVPSVLRLVPTTAA